MSVASAFLGLFGASPEAEHPSRLRSLPKPARIIPQPSDDLPAEQPARHAEWVIKMLVEYFGDDRSAIEFARAHAGVTIVVPTMPMIERIAVEGQIITEITRDPSSQAASRLASVHNVPRRAVSKLTKRVTGIGVVARRQRLHCRHPRHSGRIRFRV